jgi:alcohol dehydrogenase class IV
MATNEGQISDYKGFDRVVQRKAPLIAIPTTAGTGSEVTRAAGITDTSRKVKIVIIDSTLAPEVAIDDPQLTLTLPPSITAHTGIDALSHAIEAYVSRQGNPISDALSLESIRLIGKNLPTAWRDPENLDARTSMMLGQFIAGMAVMNAQVCLVHGMSRPLGAYFHIPHGMGNAMLLPVVMRFNVGAMDDPGRYARMAEILTDESVDSSASAAALAAVDRVEQLCRELQIPALKDLDIDRSTYDGLIPQMAEDCLASGSPGNNPIQATKEQVMELYRTLWEVGG